MNRPACDARSSRERFFSGAYMGLPATTSSPSKTATAHRPTEVLRASLSLGTRLLLLLKTGLGLVHVLPPASAVL